MTFSPDWNELPNAMPRRWVPRSWNSAGGPEKWLTRRPAALITGPRSRRSWSREHAARSAITAWSSNSKGGSIGSTGYYQAQAIEWAPRIPGAIVILIVAWLVARAVQWAIAKAVDRIPALKKHYDAEPGRSLGSILGQVAFWLILLIGILLALQPLQLGGVLSPVQQLTTVALSFIPNMIGAALIFIIGLVIAKIARRLVEAALGAASADKWINKATAVVAPEEPAETGPERSTPAWNAPRPPAARGSISKSVGMLVFLLIMIPVTISALDALKIQAFSQPATEMLRTILDSIPNVLGALILLAIGYFIGKLVKQAVDQILPTMGFDRAIGAMGVSGPMANPSRAFGSIAMIAVMIFFAIKAAELLQSPLIATMLAAILELGSKGARGSSHHSGGRRDRAGGIWLCVKQRGCKTQQRDLAHGCSAMVDYCPLGCDGFAVHGPCKRDRHHRLHGHIGFCGCGCGARIRTGRTGGGRPGA